MGASSYCESPFELISSSTSKRSSEDGGHGPADQLSPSPTGPSQAARSHLCLRMFVTASATETTMKSSTAPSASTATSVRSLARCPQLGAGGGLHRVRLDSYFGSTPRTACIRSSSRLSASPTTSAVCTAFRGVAPTPVICTIGLEYPSSELGATV